MEIKKILYIVIIFLLFVSCNKTKKDSAIHSAIKLLPCEIGFNDVKMVASINGNLLICLSFSTSNAVIQKQLFNYIKPNGELIKSFRLSDSIFSDFNMISETNGGFMIVASAFNRNYISLFKTDENCNVILTKNLAILNNANGSINIIKSYDNNYLIRYSDQQPNNYILRCDKDGNQINFKKISTPHVPQKGAGSRVSESVGLICQPNDSQIILQVETTDQFVSTGFDFHYTSSLRGMDNNIKHKWFSKEFDSVNNEFISGLIYSSENKILLFGTKYLNSNNLNSTIWPYGIPFVKKYSVSGGFENEILLPKADGKSTLIYKTIATADGGYLMVGANNYFGKADVISSSKIVVMKINSALNLSWSKTFNAIYPAIGYSVKDLHDGSIAVISIVKENSYIDKLIYMHLDANGNLIQ